ncbi:amidohydrolase family protein [Microlunatus soli]|uniref:Predicted metal-dependent hydrolase, TIM-barrel fold n=1 Tax=Microlunatus soli TaxID=630515 RepID=A0A1H1VJL8_9ACTN|nr:amidohydrolase family protein [Microlunatus soli]SDS84925.1 Predicted metal-dependent hydrolase, TIM-barrel fold [Microlunatus soli]
MARYSGPIVDAHQHFWRPGNGRIPWLRPESRIDFRYGDYSAIKRDYLPPDLLRDAGDLRLVGSVWMETEWDRGDPVGEIRDLLGTRTRYGLPDAAVAHAVLADPDVDRTLAALRAETDLVRAIRNKPGQAPIPELATARPTLMSDPQWQRGYARLAAHGLGFELQTAWWHLDEALALTRSHPEIPIMINHAGLPADRSPEALSGWAAALRRIAAADQVAIKISGIGLPGRRWTVSDNRLIVDTVAEIFGTQRILFASNFPVDSLVASYREIYDGFLTITESWSPDEQRAAFIDNAIRLYRLDPAVAQRTNEFLRRMIDA